MKYMEHIIYSSTVIWNVCYIVSNIDSKTLYNNLLGVLQISGEPRRTKSLLKAASKACLMVFRYVI